MWSYREGDRDSGTPVGRQLARAANPSHDGAGAGRRTDPRPDVAPQVEDPVWARGRSDESGLPGRRLDGGRPLPAELRPYLEARTGTPLGDVRVHTGPAARRRTEEAGATAVTSGPDIAFAPGAYRPDTPEGVVRLLHEAIHTAQHRGSGSPTPQVAARQEAEVDAVLAAPAGALGPTAAGPVPAGPTLAGPTLVGPTPAGPTPAWTTSAPGLLREPTYPRRTTGAAMIREAERVLTLVRDPASSDPTLAMWSNVPQNFGAVTAGTIARRIWTHIFSRHFTEADSAPGVESVHPRYFYSRTYGWVDGQHFFGFIDYAERDAAGRTTAQAFDASTRRGFEIERDQQRIRDYVMLQRRPDPGVTRLMQVRPPNTPAFRVPVAVAQSAATMGALAAAELMSGPTERSLLRQLTGAGQYKMLADSAKSAWTFEDPTSNQLGIRFWHRYGPAINAMSPAAREVEFRRALAEFFTAIGVVDNQAELDRLAANLPGVERYGAPHTTEAAERAAHPDLYRPPP